MCQREYHGYYNQCRTHSGRGGDTPIETPCNKVVDINKYGWEKQQNRVTSCHQLPSILAAANQCPKLIPVATLLTLQHALMHFVNGIVEFFDHRLESRLTT